MKKSVYILCFMIPIFLCAKQPWYKSAPMDYMWKNVGNAGFSAGQADQTALAISPSGEPYVVFKDVSDSNKATVMKFNGTNWVYVGNRGFSSGLIGSPSIAISSSGEPFVSYSEVNHGLFWMSAAVKKFDGTNWVNAGNQNFGAQVWPKSLDFSSTGELYIALQDTITGTPKVMKFDGNSWTIVGTGPFGTPSQYTTLAVSSSGQPYVAYQDMSTSNWQPTVMKFDGTTWTFVGSEGFSAEYVDYTSLAISPSGEPYLAFSDYNNYSLIVVLKFNGNDWEYVGNAGISLDAAYYPNLVFNPAGEPYVAFNDEGYSYKATLMRFNGSSWETIGGGGFSAGMSKYESLAFSPSATAYVAYSDGSASFKSTVMKYDSVFVGINDHSNTNLTIYPNPANHEITITDASNLNKDYTVSIYSITGEFVKQYLCRYQPQVVIDLSNMDSGIYLINLQTDSGIEVQKLVVQ